MGGLDNPRNIYHHLRRYPVSQFFLTLKPQVSLDITDIWPDGRGKCAVRRWIEDLSHGQKTADRVESNFFQDGQKLILIGIWNARRWDGFNRWTSTSRKIGRKITQWFNRKYYEYIPEIKSVRASGELWPVAIFNFSQPSAISALQISHPMHLESLHGYFPNRSGEVQLAEGRVL